ncbi:hypothetical protein JTB14_009897 [Gonioctena quinquepunctata]|nr:hypothetical protein JTB14_009897 [Gonioctena quinquepunctata]
MTWGLQILVNKEVKSNKKHIFKKKIDLLWIDGHPSLPNNFYTAKQRLDILMKKLETDVYYEDYDGVFKAWLREDEGSQTEFHEDSTRSIDTESSDSENSTFEVNDETSQPLLSRIFQQNPSKLFDQSMSKITSIPEVTMNNPKPEEQFGRGHRDRRLSIKQAISKEEESEWKEAMEEEKKVHVKNSTWKLVDRSEAKDKRIISSRWILKMRHDDRYHARLVVRGYRRDLDCPVLELTRSRPHEEEDLISFGTRLQLIRSSVAQRISNDTNSQADEKVYQISHHDKVALSTFIAEDAMAYINEYDNFEKLYGFSHENLKSKLNATTTYRQTYTPNMHSYKNFQQPEPNQFYRQFPSTNPNFSARPNWPNQPMNIQPRQLPPQKYPTNRVFGPPQNVFKPNQTPSNQLPKPEPMSTISRNPTRMSQRPFSQQPGPSFRNHNPNYFQNPQRFVQSYLTPNFISEELFSNEYEEPIVFDNQFYGNQNYEENTQYFNQNAQMKANFGNEFFNSENRHKQSLKKLKIFS